MRVAVLIPMLGKAGIIHEIKPLSFTPGNRVLLADDFAKIENLSDRYTSLTASEGLLSEFLPEDAKGFDLTISIKPETGRSWEVPVALAHWLMFHGHEIVVENPDLIVWSTGALQADGDVKPDSYEVVRKLKDSEESLRKLGSAQLLMFLPYKQNTNEAFEQFPTAKIQGFATLNEAIAGLADLNSGRVVVLPQTISPQMVASSVPEQDATTTLWKTRTLTGSAAVAALLLLTTGAWFYTKLPTIQTTAEAGDGSAERTPESETIPLSSEPPSETPRRSKEDIETMLDLFDGSLEFIAESGETWTENAGAYLATLGFTPAELREVACQVVGPSSEFYEVTTNNSCRITITGKNFRFEERMIEQYDMSSSDLTDIISIEACYTFYEICREIKAYVYVFFAEEDIQNIYELLR